MCVDPLGLPSLSFTEICSAVSDLFCILVSFHPAPSIGEHHVCQLVNFKESSLSAEEYNCITVSCSSCQAIEEIFQRVHMCTPL